MRVKLDMGEHKGIVPKDEGFIVHPMSVRYQGPI